jgi:hypothetical protein
MPSSRPFEAYRVARIRRTLDYLSQIRDFVGSVGALLTRLIDTRRTRVLCGTFEILVSAAPGTMTVSVRAPLLALPYEIELCFHKIAIAIARVENCDAAKLGTLAWEWLGESRHDYFVLRRPCRSRDYPHAIERELRAIVAGNRRETLH